LPPRPIHGPTPIVIQKSDDGWLTPVKLVRLPAEESAVRRYVEELWIPYNSELEELVDWFALADDVDLIEEETEFRLGRLESDGYRAWVAVAGEEDDVDLATVDADLVGFVTTSVDECSTVFDYADRLVVGDLYVREDHRGAGLAERMIDRAAERAREAGCGELVLSVDVENDRAIAFYEKLGFEPFRRRLSVPVEEL